MCGIAGILSPAGRSVTPEHVLSMTNCIRHRGPDDEGYAVLNMATGTLEPRKGSDTVPEISAPSLSAPMASGDPITGVLGWRRLAIIDTSPGGHQPMRGADGRLTIVFNGEIYNHVELRSELRTTGYTFHSASDTEVILAAYERWGPGCVSHFNGMWAFAIWDSQKRSLFCARDRFGIKPFYYAWDGERFSFASEIKALLTVPWIVRRANDAAVYRYLVDRVTDSSEETFFDGIRQIRPGHCLTLTQAGPAVEQFYDLPYESGFGSYNESVMEKEAADVRELFTDAVRLRLRSDVPVGSCLSGGLDSSSIVCTTASLFSQERSALLSIVGERQRTFTSTYADPALSEDAFVRIVIDRSNAQPSFTYPDARGLAGDLAAFVTMQDEPVVSTSPYAQWCVMRLAAGSGVKVLLDGQGGDELFAGYRWHIPILLAQVSRRSGLSAALDELRSIAATSRTPALGLALAAIRKRMKEFASPELTRRLAERGLFLHAGFAGSTRLPDLPRSDDDLQTRLHQEFTFLNLQQLLRYEDRNSMAFSLEARLPFLDYRLAEKVMAIPGTYKVRDGWTKYVLRRSMQGVLPETIQWRRDKMGFVTPERAWTEALIPRMRAMVDGGELRSARFLDWSGLGAALQSQTWRQIRSDTLWRALNLEEWMRQFRVL